MSVEQDRTADSSVRADEVLRATEARYRAFLESTAQAITVIDASATVVMVNDRSVELFGARGAEDLVGRNAIDLIAPEDRVRAMSAMQPTAAAGGVKNVQYSLLRLDGSRFRAEISSTPLRDAEGRLEGFIATAWDITDRKAAEEARRESEERFRAVFQEAPMGVALQDMNGYIVDANRAYVDMIGMELETLRSTHVSMFTYPGDNERQQELERALIAGEIARYGIEKRYLRPDGETVWAHLTASLLHDVDGKPRYIIGMAQDISEQKRAAEALTESQERYRELFENATDVVFTIDLGGRFTSINAAARTLSGYSEEEALSMSIAQVIAPEHLALASAMIQEKLENRSHTGYQLDLIARDGTRIPLEVNTRLISHNGKPVGVQGIGRDIRERRRFEETLRHQALYDALTDLPNRTLFDDRLGQAVASARRESTALALLVMDLDRFKDVNDSFGHHYGNLLLQQVAARLRRVLRVSDTVARLGGDEFALLLPGATLRHASTIARKVRQTLVAPFVLEDQVVEIGASIGIAVFPRHGDDLATLLQRADIAMYVAKRNHSDYAIYSAEQDENAADRLNLMAELRPAMEHNHLLLHFQPTIDLRTGRANHLEALVRWPHPSRGLLPPGDFIPLAEHTGLIAPMTRWVLKSALIQSTAWRAAGLTIPIAVNLSARSLHDPRLVHAIARLLHTYETEGRSLILELTESAVMSDPMRSMNTLGRLHDMGMQISIDDFGTGYSSLAYLKRLPVDEIKIDRSFVADLSGSEENRFIVRSIIDLGHNLGMKVVAEGVEDEATLQLLRSLECDIAQGYYISRPLAADEAAEWIRQRSAAE